MKKNRTKDELSQEACTKIVDKASVFYACLLVLVLIAPVVIATKTIEQKNHRTQATTSLCHNPYDFNFDGKVDMCDLTFLCAHYNHATPKRCDLNHDGIIDIYDVVTWIYKSQYREP